MNPAFYRQIRKLFDPEETAANRLIWLMPSSGAIARFLEEKDSGRQLKDASIKRLALPERGVLIVIQHRELRGVTPTMLEWWFSFFPYVAISQPNGEILTAYELWHPKDHRSARITLHSLSGQLGMASGAKLEFKSRWGQLRRKSLLMIRRMDETGLSANFKLGSRTIATLEEDFEKTTTGTNYISSLIVGPTSRYFTLARSTRCFTPRALDAWTLHKIEEIGNLERILPDLYAWFRDNKQGVDNSKNQTSIINDVELDLMDQSPPSLTS